MRQWVRLRGPWAAACVVVVGLALAARPPGAASAPTPAEQLKAQVDRVIAVLEDPAFKADGRAGERRAAVRRIAEEIFDFGETGRRALARHWQARTPAERQEFVRLFADLLEHSYISRIEAYGGERIVYLDDSVDGDQALVRTRIVTLQGSEIPVDYRMSRRGDRWVVHDVIIESVSLVANYRTQFNRIIATSSYQELINRLRARRDELSGPPAGQR